jgi:phosphocarrier protein HPr
VDFTDTLFLYYTFSIETRGVSIEAAVITGKRRKNMEIVTVTVTNPFGLHARPASLLSIFIRDFASDIMVYKNGDSSRKINAKSVLSVMDLNASMGDELTFEACGEDRRKRSRQLKDLQKTVSENRR